MNLRPHLRLLACAFLFVSTLAFAQTPSPAASASPAAAPVRIVIVGDSTVSNYPPPHPNRGWGMYIEERFQPGTVSVLNLATPGRSTKTFIKEGRWQTALDAKPDYVLIQFGHNDSHPSNQPEATDPGTDYPANLRRYIDDARKIGAIPVLVTPMVRRNYDAQGKITDDQKSPAHSLQLYVEAMKAIGQEKKVPVIDLHTSSKALMEKLGPVEAARLANKKGDNTHFNEKGARTMADLVMKELLVVEPKLQQYLAASPSSATSISPAP